MRKIHGGDDQATFARIGEPFVRADPDEGCRGWDQLIGHAENAGSWLIRARSLNAPREAIRLWPMHSLSQTLLLPDLWQQEAVRALRDGKDVVVDAPTGAGKTHIFELLHGSFRGQAVFTVPTRALANDKLADWQRRGWDVGIATGDLAMRLDAPVLVATLETQKANILRRRGPRLLVIDEYQMIGDEVRGVNYELAIALAPRETQLLLLSGSVANPQDIVTWLRRIGRDAVLVAHRARPVPLEEVDLDALPNRERKPPSGKWPRLIGNALRAELGPVLMFAPRRRVAEELAEQLAAHLPLIDPLTLTAEQNGVAGQRLARLLHARVAYHHSGLSYAQRAGVIEPLAKNGQLRVVVATMGLAAGINFSMRSVVITGTTYRAGNYDRQVRPDELLQMFGRAGRRGLDETGYALITSQPPRLHDARARQLRRAAPVDWPTLIAVMRAAGENGERPFDSAVELNKRLFSPVDVPLGVEHSLATGPMPCGLWIDDERARLPRRGLLEMQNGHGTWEAKPAGTLVRLGDALVFENGAWIPALSRARQLEGIGVGNLCRLGESGVFGRELTLGTRQGDGRLLLTPRIKKILKLTRVDAEQLQRELIPRLPEISGGGDLLELFPRENQLVARFGFAAHRVEGFLDAEGRALLAPPERRELPLCCRGCVELPWCLGVEIVPSTAMTWRQLGLIEPDGTPTRRGIIFSFLHHGEGLAVAAALEQPDYAIDDLVFDLANLRAGPRFAGDDSPYGGRLGILCQQTFGRLDLPGYLELGVPLDYGAGASEVVREIVTHSTARQKFVTDLLRQGDLERALIEWRSLLRHIAAAPEYDWERWSALQRAAAHHVEATTSPTVAALPALAAAQRIRRA
jgi:superfamily II DNA/RNA helicase